VSSGGADGTKNKTSHPADNQGRPVFHTPGAGPVASVGIRAGKGVLDQTPDRREREEQKRKEGTRNLCATYTVYSTYEKDKEGGA